MIDMAEHGKRRRLAKSSDVSDASTIPNTSSSTPSTPAAIHDKRNWNGFCEVESEPVSAFFGKTPYSSCQCLTFFLAFFNTILKSFGVSGVKVHEVVSLDKDILNDLPYVLPSISRLECALF